MTSDNILVWMNEWWRIKLNEIKICSYVVYKDKTVTNNKGQTIMNVSCVTKTNDTQENTGSSLLVKNIEDTSFWITIWLLVRDFKSWLKT